MSVRVSASQLYSSATAVSLVCQALSHVSATRTLLCRDALLLLKLCLRLGEHVRERTPGFFPASKSNGDARGRRRSRKLFVQQALPGGGPQLLQIQQEVIPRTSQLLSSYFLLRHLSRSVSVQVAEDAA